MRSEDYQMAQVIKFHWHGIDTRGISLCPLLADLGKLLTYLDTNKIRPGDAIMRCPECGDDHRWVLLRDLMEFALDIKPKNQWTPLMKAVDDLLEPVRKAYGGDAGYRTMTIAADDFFTGLDAGNKFGPSK